MNNSNLSSGNFSSNIDGLYAIVEKLETTIGRFNNPDETSLLEINGQLKSLSNLSEYMINNINYLLKNKLYKS